MPGSKKTYLFAVLNIDLKQKTFCKILVARFCALNIYCRGQNIIDKSFQLELKNKSAKILWTLTSFSYVEF